MNYGVSQIRKPGNCTALRGTQRTPLAWDRLYSSYPRSLPRMRNRCRWCVASYLCLIGRGCRSTFAQQGPAQCRAPQSQTLQKKDPKPVDLMTDARPPSPAGQKARLALLSPVSSKSPSGSSFMAKLVAAVEVTAAGAAQRNSWGRPPGTSPRAPPDAAGVHPPGGHGIDRIKLPDGRVQPRAGLSPRKRLRQGRQRRTVPPHYEQEAIGHPTRGTALVAKLADDLSEEVLATRSSARWYGLAPALLSCCCKKGGSKTKPGQIIDVDSFGSL